MKVRVKPKEPVSSKWSDTYYVLSYQCAKDGYSDRKIAERIGVNQFTFRKWIAERPALADALEKGRERSDETFREYVYRNLPPELKELYDQITSLDDEGDPLNQIAAILSDKGEKVKQHLFLHTLVESDFDPSSALAKLRLTKTTLDNWVRNDPDFGRLCQEVIFHRKNFLEGALFRLVKQGDKGAIVFANRTLNSDRGYGNAVKVQHEGEVVHTGQIGVHELPLALIEKKKILQAYKAKQEQIEDAEFE